MQYALYEQILYAMQSISCRQKVMPKDLLGRSLAYNCFLPRLSNKAYLYENLKSNKKALYSNTLTLTKVLQTRKFQHNEIESSELICVLFDDSSLYHPADLEGLETKSESLDTMDFLSMIRRLSPFFVIHDSVFVDEYQILESAIGGADMVILDVAHLRAYCKCVSVLECNEQLLDFSVSEIARVIYSSDFISSERLEFLSIAHIDKFIAFAYNLGLVPIVRIQNKVDLESLFNLQNFPHCIYVAYNGVGDFTSDTCNAVGNIIDLLPKESIIFTKNGIANFPQFTLKSSFIEIITPLDK